jgi:hypothetical protein
MEIAKSNHDLRTICSGSGRIRSWQRSLPPATLTRYGAAFICRLMIRSSAIIAAEKRRRRAKTARARA